MSQSQSITREMLEANDPRFTERGNERRYLCPYCGLTKRKDNAHRSLCLNIEKGLWKCWRCDAKGKLVQSDGKDLVSVEERAALRRQAVAQKAEDRIKFRENMDRVLSLQGTPGATYLLKERGIPFDLAHSSGVRYSPDYYGAKAVLFPIYDHNQKLVAVNARYCDTFRHVKHRTSGEKMRGFFSTAGALQSPTVLICEAAIDALTIALAGYPAVATCGSGLPDYLLAHCVGRKVVVATDNDEEGEGDALAARWTSILNRVGVRVTRARPPEKDWNAVLVKLKTEYLETLIAEKLALDEVIRTNSP